MLFLTNINISLTPFENIFVKITLVFGCRKAKKLGDIQLVDGMVKDGLTDVYNKVHMGTCADECAKEYNISREEQDQFAIESYQKASSASSNGLFKDEIVKVSVPQRKKEDIVIKADEEFNNVKIEKIPNLKPVFSKDGTVTALVFATSLYRIIFRWCIMARI